MTLMTTIAGILLSPVLAAESAQPADPDILHRTEVYKTIGDMSLKVHIFESKESQGQADRPAIVFFFGGGWVNGNPKQFFPHCEYLAGRGMVAMSAEYRIRSTHKTTPFECVKDGKSAVRWIRANARRLGVDPGRVAAGGGSAGGHVGASTALIPGCEEEGEDLSISSMPDALVLFNPVIDTTGKGYGQEKLGGREKELSPAHHVRPGLPPAIIFHGKVDTTVPYENVERFQRLMTENGNVCRLEGFEGHKHGFFNYGRNPGVFDATMAATDTFLALHLTPAELTQAEYKAARKKAAHRTRRIIMNNDGNDLHRLDANAPVTPEAFLRTRSTPLVGSQVDTIFYCTGVFNLYTQRSDETELVTHDKAAARNIYKLAELGTDSIEVMTGFGRQNGMEVFWTMRMNDTHDSGNDILLCQWKQDHPEYLVGEKGKKLPYGCNRWSSVDYGIAEVRDKVYRIFEDVCTRYDVDGIEMDFFRHPVLFRPQMTGEPVTQEHCDRMTGLVRRIRAMTEEVGRKRGRPMLISVRVPDSVGYCKALGIDLERWLADELIDMVAGSGYFKLEPWENLAALGDAYDAPVYAVLVSRRLMNGGKPEAGTALKVWRGEAYSAWKAGVDGIYTFNRFDPTDPIFRELGDPERLETLERIDQVSYVADIWSRPESWLKDGDRFVCPAGKEWDEETKGE